MLVGETGLNTKSRVNIWNRGEGQGGWRTDHRQDISIAKHETSFSELMPSPTSTGINRFVTVFIRDTDKLQGKVWPIRRHVHINPIRSIPGNLHGHVQDIGGDGR
jgi:hypothetical protein